MKLFKVDDIILLVMKVKENILIDKSIEFAARIIKLQRYLIKNKKETVYLNK